MSIPSMKKQVFGDINLQLNAMRKKMPAFLFKFILKVMIPYKRAVNNILGKTINSRDFLKSLVITLLYFLPVNTLGRIISKKIKMRFGGKLKRILCGGAMIAPHIDAFFNSIGIPIHVGYGLTEGAPVCCRFKNRIIWDTMGDLMGGSTIKICNKEGEVVEKGEVGILYVKGDHITPGYYKGDKFEWLNTGDLVKLNSNDTLSFEGRISDRIVLSNGENVDPTLIEERLLKYNSINQIVLVGQDKKTLKALINPNATEATMYSLKEDIEKDVKDANSHLPSFQKITGFILIEVLKIGEELTGLMKTKRNVVEEKYKDKIEAMYV